MLLSLRFYLFWKEGELEWLVHSILGALLEDLFTIWWKKRLEPIFGLCMMCDVIVFQILLILEGRWAGWLVHSILEDLFIMWRKKRFDPIFALCKMCDVIVFQILLVFEGRWAWMARPQHLGGSLGGFIYYMMEETFWPHFWLCKMWCYCFSDWIHFGRKVGWNGSSTAS